MGQRLSKPLADDIEQEREPDTVMDQKYVTNNTNRWTVKTPQPLDRSKVSKTREFSFRPNPSVYLKISLTKPVVVPFVFEPLPLGSIKPLGWMKDQLQLMADGLPGNLHTFYNMVTNAPWLGGDVEYSPLNEAWPYWYNGVVALAHGLDDERLKDYILKVTNEVLRRQFKDGWIGPENDLSKRNFWGRYPFLLGLMQLTEAVGPERSKTMVDAMHKFVVLMHKMLENDNQGYVKKSKDDFDEQWGRSRAADLIIFLQWLYEKHPRENTYRIWDAMVHIYDHSYDWTYWFSPNVFCKDDFDLLPEGDVRGAVFPYIHGVNAGQGLKYGAVMRRLTHIDQYVKDTQRGTEWTLLYHGSPSGGIIGDEGESGVGPDRGVELCSVVETIYSLTYNYQTLGLKEYADKAELAAYNALPVMFTDDMWAHQYVAQTNQPLSHTMENPPFWNVGANGVRFGTEPNYPCCAVNHPQGLPKYLSASFVKKGSNGIAHALLMPTEVQIAFGDNNAVHIKCETNYPFEHSLKYFINAAASFDFSVRIPGWADSHIINVNGTAAEYDTSQYDNKTGLHTIQLDPGPSRVEVIFLTSPRIRERSNDSVAVYYGALLYALPVPAKWQSERPEHYPGSAAPKHAKDWTATPEEDFKWNIAIDPSTITIKLAPSHKSGQDLPNPIWTTDATPNRISVMACELKNWKLTSKSKGYAPTPPGIDDRTCKGEPFEVELQPYGALKLHMAEFPRVKLT